MPFRWVQKSVFDWLRNCWDDFNGRIPTVPVGAIHESPVFSGHTVEVDIIHPQAYHSIQNPGTAKNAVPGTVYDKDYTPE